MLDPWLSDSCIHTHCSVCPTEMQKGFAPFFSDIPVQLGMLSARLLPCIFILLKIVYSPAEHSDLLAPVSLWALVGQRHLLLLQAGCSTCIYQLQQLTHPPVSFASVFFQNMLCSRPKESHCTWFARKWMSCLLPAVESNRWNYERDISEIKSYLVSIEECRISSSSLSWSSKFDTSRQGFFSNRSRWSIFLDYKESASTAAFVVISHDNLSKNLLLVVDGQMIVLN